MMTETNLVKPANCIGYHYNSIIITLTMFIHHLMYNKSTFEVAYKLSWWLKGTVWSLILILLIWSQENSSSFIYFQF
jgi:hypothetical protein